MALYFILADVATPTLIDTILQYSWIIFLVAVGLGMVIFVHELGHFLVAKACGVKCEKFYIGFDIGGYKLAKVQWGETEYGIGILPLGGYVKMLGQDDNPARIAEETRRSQIAVAPSGEIAPEPAGDGAAETPAGEQKFAIDPRSYLAKSVPQRMAIISAGVVMNVIFAFIFAVIAYKMGVQYNPSIVSGVAAASPAWRENIQVGDEIIEIAGVKQPRFREDLVSSVSLADLEKGIPLVIQRPGVESPIHLPLKPEVEGYPLPRIGVAPPRSLTLVKQSPTLTGSPAAAATPAFEGDDRIIAIDGQPVSAYHELAQALVLKEDQSIEVTVARGEGDAETTHTITVGANPLRRVGLVMEFGPIVAIQKQSPAEAAGLAAGDTLVTLDGQSIEDPMLLSGMLRGAAATGATVELGVRKADAKRYAPLEPISIAPRMPKAPPFSGLGDPLDVPELGVAIGVSNVVAAVTPGGSAQTEGIKAGDVLVEAKFLPAEDDDSAIARQLAKDAVKFDKDSRNWPALFDLMQSLPSDVQVVLTVESGGERRQATLTPAAEDGQYIPERGFFLMPLTRTRTAETIGEAVALGARETKDALFMVFRFINKLFERQISPRMLGGPITIAQAAGNSASVGVSSLLIFLTLLSANLAVINFLPIPLLDGGHMVFLTLEGILRRPVSEKVVVAFHTAGFVFIISLMLFVLGLDFGIIPRGL